MIKKDREKKYQMQSPACIVSRFNYVANYIINFNVKQQQLDDNISIRRFLFSLISILKLNDAGFSTFASLPFASLRFALPRFELCFYYIFLKINYLVLNLRINYSVYENSITRQDMNYLRMCGCMYVHN